MLFKGKKSLPTLQLYAQNNLIYHDLLKDLPLKESVILAKSVEFFDDPEPCHIHRSAVRTRLTAEIQNECTSFGIESAPGPLLLSYADFLSIDRYVFTR